MPTYKFRYFNGRGLGEVCRLLFALKGQEFEDVRTEMEQWENEKANTPFGQLPVLEMDGKQYAQSGAISRYLAKTFGFYGKDDLEALEIDQVLGIGQDLTTNLYKAQFEKNAERKEEFMKDLKDVKLPLYLGMLEKILKNKESKLCVGDTISLADLYVFDVCQKLDELVNFNDYPNLKQCREKVGEEPKIKAYVEKRPVTNF